MPLSVVGKATLNIEFAGKIGDADNIQGLFLLGESGDNPYIFSQFQEMEARRVFPSLDEPNKKAIFSFTVDIPEGMGALHNTRPLAVTHTGLRKIVQFASTPQINTDVLALAVGNFANTTLPTTALKSQVYSPIDIPLNTPAGLGLLVNQTVEYMSDYLDTPFPYDKLDFFVSPLGTLAAMENVGLIALNTNQIPGTDSSDYDVCEFNKLIAHEIVHMWFGNSITMRWYNDFWLNESFTEFFAAKIIQQYYPNNQTCTFIPQSEAFKTDNPRAKPIKRAVKNRADNEGSGQLYYTKGRSVLEMLEEHVGQDLLRLIMRRYVEAYHGKNVTTSDFTKLFPPQYFVADIIASFTEQSGYPLISVFEEHGKLYIAQQSYHGEHNKLWTLPLSLKVIDNNGIAVHHFLLNHEKQLLKGISPEQALFVNGDGVGYYRWESQESTAIFPLKKLTMSERLASMDNNDALANSGRLNFKTHLDQLIRIIADLPSNEPEVETALDALIDYFIEMIPADLQSKYADYLKRKLPSNLPWETLISLENGGKWLELYGVYLNSDDAVRFTKDYFSTTTKAELKSRLGVFRVLVSNATDEEYDTLLKLFNSNDRSIQEDALDSLGYVTNKKQLTRFYDFLLSKETTGFVIDYRFQYPIFQPKLRQEAANYIKNHLQSISLRVPDDQLQWFPFNFLTACSQDEIDLVKNTFAGWSNVSGIDEKLQVVLEDIDNCQINSRKAIKQVTTF